MNKSRFTQFFETTQNEFEAALMFLYDLDRLGCMNIPVDSVSRKSISNMADMRRAISRQVISDEHIRALAADPISAIDSTTSIERVDQNADRIEEALDRSLCRLLNASRDPQISLIRYAEIMGQVAQIEQLGIWCDTYRCSQGSKFAYAFDVFVDSAFIEDVDVLTLTISLQDDLRQLIDRIDVDFARSIANVRSFNCLVDHLLRLDEDDLYCVVISDVIDATSQQAFDNTLTSRVWENLVMRQVDVSMKFRDLVKGAIDDVGREYGLNPALLMDGSNYERIPGRYSPTKNGLVPTTHITANSHLLTLIHGVQGIDPGSLNRMPFGHELN